MHEFMPPKFERHTVGDACPLMPPTVQMMHTAKAKLD